MISTVGIRSSAVPTMITRTMITNISRILLSMKGSSSCVTCAGMLAMVMSQADTSAQATRNSTVLEVLAALSTSAGRSGELELAVDEAANQEGVDHGDHRSLGRREDAELHAADDHERQHQRPDAVEQAAAQFAQVEAAHLDLFSCFAHSHQAWPVSVSAIMIPGNEAGQEQLGDRDAARPRRTPR